MLIVSYVIYNLCSYLYSWIYVKKLQSDAVNAIIPEHIVELPLHMNSGLEDLVRKEFADTPVLIRISSCESHFRQYEDDGTIRRGRINSEDVGIFQINEHYHLEASKKIGIDIYTVSGQIAYTRLLYAKNGTRDWNWSRWCWDPDSDKK